MRLTLYHSVESTCSQKVRFVLSEKNLQWEENTLNLRKGEQFSPEYLKLNPKAVVPTLVHEGKVVRESSVIIEYLDDVFPHPGLRPSDPYDRAVMRLLLKTFDEEVHGSVGILSYAIVLRHQMDKLKTRDEMEEHFKNIVDPGRRQRQQGTHYDGLKAPSAGTAVQTLKKVTRLMNDCLGENMWLAGSEFSLADATAIPYMVRINAMNLSGLWHELGRIQPWMDRAIEKCNAYDLDEPWGSESFKKLVAGYVAESDSEIQSLINNF